MSVITPTPSSSPREETQAMFSWGLESAEDLLNNAAAVTRFLADVSSAFSNDGMAPGLGDEAAMGLSMILSTLEGTINEAIARL